MIDLLQYHKVCIRWLPHELTDDKKAARMMASLQSYAVEGNRSLCEFLTGDEVLIYHVTPISMQSIKHGE